MGLKDVVGIAGKIALAIKPIVLYKGNSLKLKLLLSFITSNLITEQWEETMEDDYLTNTFAWSSIICILFLFKFLSYHLKNILN